MTIDGALSVRFMYLALQQGPIAVKKVREAILTNHSGESICEDSNLQ